MEKSDREPVTGVTLDNAESSGTKNNALIDDEVKYPLKVVKACLMFYTRQDEWQHSRSGRFNIRRNNVVTHLRGQKRSNLDLEVP